MKNIIGTIGALYENCLIASIAHAFAIARFPDIANEISWDGNNFNIQSGESRGTITFSNCEAVGAFRKESSIRINEYPQKKAISFFDEAPEVVQHIAKADTLEYLYDNIDGLNMPVATTGFWTEKNHIYSLDTLEIFEEQGGIIVKNILQKNSGEALEFWVGFYDLNEVLSIAIKNLSKKRNATSDREIIITIEELLCLVGDEAMTIDDVIESLSEIKIRVER